MDDVRNLKIDDLVNSDHMLLLSAIVGRKCQKISVYEVYFYWSPESIEEHYRITKSLEIDMGTLKRTIHEKCKKN